METDEIISEIRFITGYPELVVSDEKINDAINFTKNEMRSIFQDEELEFTTHFADMALVWGGSYHLKVHTGEIGGVPISIGDLDLSRLNRSRGNSNGDILQWAVKFYDNIYRMEEAPLKMGSTNEIRTGRTYGDSSGSSSSDGSNLGS